MIRLFLSILLLLCFGLCIKASENIATAPDSSLCCIAAGDSIITTTSPSSAAPDSTALKADSTATRLWWRDAIKQRRFNIGDTTIAYPKFLNFCVNVYRWGNKYLNSYDSAYVKSVGKKWKIQLRYNGMIGTYHGKIRDGDLLYFINSRLVNYAGLRVQFLIFGLEYMPDIDNLLSGRPIMHRATRFSINCNRLFAELYYIKNVGTVSIRRFGDYNNGRSFKLSFDGMDRRVLGFDAFYIFNHQHYAHSAAYGISKLQLRSAGSFILGIQYSKQECDFDTSLLPDGLKPYTPQIANNLNFLMKDYAINIGYGYNWVFHRNWLFNITATPSLGLKRIKSPNDKDYSYHIATNFRGRISLVHNRNHFYYGLYGTINGNWFNSTKYLLYVNVFDINAIAGFRF